MSHGKVSLSPLPIAIPRTDAEKAVVAQIERLVDEVVALSLRRYALLGAWKEWSTKIGNGETTLFKILQSDGMNLRRGRSAETLSEKASFYPPSGGTEFEETYKLVTPVPGENPNSISVIALTKEGRELNIFEVSFRDSALYEHVYFSLIDLTLSRAKVKSLKHLLTKCKVTMTKPDFPAGVSAILENALAQVDQLLPTENEKRSGLARIDRQVAEVEADIDALVFRTYGLTRNDVETVSYSLQLTPSRQNAIVSAIERVSQSTEAPRRPS